MKRRLTLSFALGTIVCGALPASADQAATDLQEALRLGQEQQQQQQQQQMQQQQLQQLNNPYNMWSPYYQRTTTPFNPGGVLSDAYSRAGLCRLGDATCPDPRPQAAAYPEGADPTEAPPPAPRHHRHHRRYRPR